MPQMKTKEYGELDPRIDDHEKSNMRQEGGDLLIHCDRIPIGVKKVIPNEITAVTMALARAFQNDPVIVHLGGDRRLTVEQLMPLFDTFIRIQMYGGLVFTTPGHEAAALWAPPGKWKIGILQIIRYTPRFLRLYGNRFFSNLEMLYDIERVHPTEAHYYLEFLGTDPQHQGKGFGRALMEPMIKRADQEGMGIYLENSNEKNNAFYAKFDFKVRRIMKYSRNGPSTWLMWRDPR